jgi:hypothetical protein
MDQLTEDLKTARDLIAAPGGFVQRRLWDGNGGFCSTGALHQAISGYSCRMCSDYHPPAICCCADMRRETRERFTAACDELAAHIDGSPIPRRSTIDVIVDYNNSHTQQEVVEVFDKTLADRGALA